MEPTRPPAFTVEAVTEPVTELDRKVVLVAEPMSPPTIAAPEMDAFAKATDLTVAPRDTPKRPMFCPSEEEMVKPEMT